MINILILHYKEPKWMLERLLDSIATQRGVDFSKIHVRIANDGNEVPISSFHDYPFQLCYTIEERQGTSKLRNLLIGDVPEDEFLWFLDSDDYLLPDRLALLQDLTQRFEFDCLSMGVEKELQNGTTHNWNPLKTSRSIVCSMIYKKSFITRTQLYCADEFFLAGDIVLEQLSKYYSNRTLNIELPIIHYSYNDDSVVRRQQYNGWKEDRPKVLQYCIQKLLNDHLYKAAYLEFKMAITKYCSKTIHDKFEKTFRDLGLYELSSKLDLR